MKTCILLSLALVSSFALADKIVPFTGVVAQSDPQEFAGAAVCEFKDLGLPKDTVVYAAGAYSGKKLNQQIDQSGHEATQIDVVVNSNKPVALILGAYEPTIWNLGWTKKTKIVAIMVSGYHRQALAGLKKGTPTLNSSIENRGACGWFYLAPDQMDKVNAISQKVFNLPVKTAFAAKDGVVVVGETSAMNEEVITSDWKNVESFIDKNSPKAGQPGLDEAVEKGLIRQATESDYEKVADALYKEKNPGNRPKTKLVGFPEQRPEVRMRGSNAYTVLKKFTYPAGLYGAHSVSFIVLKGVPSPEGNPGHSAVYDLNKSPVCQGPICRMGNE